MTSKAQPKEKEEKKEIDVLSLPTQERSKMFADEYNALVNKYGVARMANPSFYPQDNGSFGISIQYFLQDLVQKN